MKKYKKLCNLKLLLAMVAVLASPAVLFQVYAHSGGYIPDRVFNSGIYKPIPFAPVQQMENQLSPVPFLIRQDTSRIPYMIMEDVPRKQDIEQLQEAEDALTRDEKKAMRAEKRALRKEVRKDRRAELRQQFREERAIDNPNNADYILLAKNLPNGLGVLEAMQGRVPGLIISNDGSVRARGPSSFALNEMPLYMVDDLQVGVGYVTALTVEEVSRIEVFIGPSASVYGTRGGVAVISIYTANYYRSGEPEY